MGIGGAVHLIVDHRTVVMFEGAMWRFKDPAGRLSAHYVIGENGRNAKLVSQDDTAYHAGDYAVNPRSIGIEHEAGPAMEPTDALHAASARLHLDLERIAREATEEDDTFTEEDLRKLDRVCQHLEACEPLVGTTRLQRWLAQAVRSGFPNADLSGPAVDGGQPFKG